MVEAGVGVAGRWNNRYIRFMGSDNDLCVPVVPQEQLGFILFETTRLAESIVGAGAKPKLSLDMEHLQVADYTAFTEDPVQQEAIRKLRASAPIRAAEMAYMALRSLVGFHWDGAASENDVRRAAAYEDALEVVLTQVSQALGEELASPESLLPYWGRLGFLRVMATIPDDQINAHKLDSFACVLLKDPVFNARSFRYETHGLIGLNYAMEPILKSLNRMLLHFFHSQHMAGPRRLERVWSSLLPVAIYFQTSSAVPVNRLARHHALFEEKMAAFSHSITASQIDFIVRHELGHLALDHGRRMRAVSDVNEARALRNEFKFAADAFAQQALRSALYNSLRSTFERDGPIDGTEPMPSFVDQLLDFQSEASGVRLLFLYMRVVDDIGKFLAQRLAHGSPAPPRPTHPSARERLDRLDAFHASEYPVTSKIVRYAEDLFAQVMEYGEALDDAALKEVVRTATANPD